MMAFAKKRSLLIATVVCLFMVQLNAQVPGYMGKRFSAGYGFYIQPAFNSILSDYGNYPVNTTHELFVEYAVGKKVALGLSAQFFRYRYNNKSDISFNPSTNGAYSLSNLSSTPSGSYLIKGRNYRFYARFYRYGYLAPWGKYFQLGLALNRYITIYDPDNMNIEGTTVVTSYATGAAVRQPYYYNDFGPTRQSFTKVDIFFGNGNNRVIADKITLDYGYTIGCISMMQMFADALDLSPTPTPDIYIERTSRARAAAINRFNIYIKVGYLF